MRLDATMSTVEGRQTLRLAIVVGALGVVFGDIGTSPLYAAQTVFRTTGVMVSPAHVYGIISLVVWAITIIVHSSTLPSSCWPTTTARAGSWP